MFWLFWPTWQWWWQKLGSAYWIQGGVLHAFTYTFCDFFNLCPKLYWICLSLQPLAVIVCPGWKKAQFIFELLGDYSASCRPLHPVLLTIGLHKDEAKNMKLPRGCKQPFQAIWFSLENTVQPGSGGPGSHPDTGLVYWPASLINYVSV